MGLEQFTLEAEFQLSGWRATLCITLHYHMNVIGCHLASKGPGAG